MQVVEEVFRTISYVLKFIPSFVELLEPFHALVKKNVPIPWGEEQQKAFQKVEDVFISPLIMMAPIKGSPLTLYLTSTNKSMSTLLA